MIRFAKGGEAEIVALDLDGERVKLSATASSPPGSVIEATLIDVNGSESIRIKVRGCKRDDAKEMFLIEGRILDVSRHLRERLSALVRVSC